MAVNIEKLRREIRKDQARLAFDEKKYRWVVFGAFAATILGSSAALTLLYKFLGLLK